jgi:hypothetical protein
MNFIPETQNPSVKKAGGNEKAVVLPTAWPVRA